MATRGPLVWAVLSAVVGTACRAEATRRWEVEPVKGVGRAGTVLLWERGGVRLAAHSRYVDDVGSLEFEIENHGRSEIAVGFFAGTGADEAPLSGTGYERPAEGVTGERGPASVLAPGAPLRVGGGRGMTVFVGGAPLFGSSLPPTGTVGRIRAHVDAGSTAFDEAVDLRVVEGPKGVRWYLGR